MVTFLVLLGSILGPRLSGADVVLQISIVDHKAIRRSDVAAQARTLRGAFPSDRLIAVTVEAPPPSVATEEELIVARRQLVDGIRAIDFGGESIRLMMINSHGNGGYTFSSLAGFGRFYSSGVNDHVREVFAPLRGHFASDARVVLTGCSVLAGERAQALRRAEALMKYLGIPDGAVFGFTVISYFFRPFPRGWLDRGRLEEALHKGLPVIALMNPRLNQVVALAAVISLYAVTLTKFAKSYRKHRRARGADRYNVGVLALLKNGRVFETLDLKRAQDGDVVGGCEANLGRTWLGPHHFFKWAHRTQVASSPVVLE